MLPAMNHGAAIPAIHLHGITWSRAVGR